MLVQCTGKKIIILKINCKCGLILEKMAFLITAELLKNQLHVQATPVWPLAPLHPAGQSIDLWAERGYSQYSG